MIHTEEELYQAIVYRRREILADPSTRNIARIVHEVLQEELGALEEIVPLRQELEGLRDELCAADQQALQIGPLENQVEGLESQLRFLRDALEAIASVRFSSAQEFHTNTVVHALVIQAEMALEKLEKM